MPWYRASVRGENFFFEVDGKVQRMGFYTNRFVEAPSANDVEESVLTQLRGDPKLQGHQNSHSDPPMLYIEEITEADRDDVPSKPHGLALFVEEANG